MSGDIADLVLGVAGRLGFKVERPDGPPQRSEPEPLQRVSRWAETLQRSLGTIPAEFQWARTLDAPDLATRTDPRALARVRAADPHVMTIFGGPSRAGKTSLATALFASRLYPARWPDGLWAPAARLILEAVRETKLGEDSPGLARARRAEVLLLDDLGEELEIENSRGLISDLIGSRHREHKTTIVTTGFPVNVLASRYGEGIRERLTEKGRALSVQCRRERTL